VRQCAAVMLQCSSVPQCAAVRSAAICGSASGGVYLFMFDNYIFLCLIIVLSFNLGLSGINFYFQLNYTSLFVFK
jgi:hypothetical protein